VSHGRYSAGPETGAYLAVEFEGDEPFLTQESDFLRENAFPQGTVKKIRALREGDGPVVFGGGAATMVKVWRPTKRERQYRHIYAEARASGASARRAKSLAAAVTNKRRALLARKHRGPKLVGCGGSRRQWFPGKRP
jgi:hypothetical protein